MITPTRFAEKYILIIWIFFVLYKNIENYFSRPPNAIHTIDTLSKRINNILRNYVLYA